MLVVLWRVGKALHRRPINTCHGKSRRVQDGLVIARAEPKPSVGVSSEHRTAGQSMADERYQRGLAVCTAWPQFPAVVSSFEMGEACNVLLAQFELPDTRGAMTVRRMQTGLPQSMNLIAEPCSAVKTSIVHHNHVFLGWMWNHSQRASSICPYLVRSTDTSVSNQDTCEL